MTLLCRCGCGTTVKNQRQQVRGHLLDKNKVPWNKGLTKETDSRVKQTCETRRSYSGKNHPMYGITGEDHPNYGRKLTGEHKEKLSKAKAGNKNPMYGKKGKLSPRHGKKPSTWNPDRLQVKTREKIRGSCKDSIRRCLKAGHTRNGKKGTFKLLGYSPDELIKHIEDLFSEGMNWGNKGEWHIDHIRPINTFPKGTDIKIINSLSNLRPLWATDNLVRPVDGSDENWNKELNE